MKNLIWILSIAVLGALVYAVNSPSTKGALKVMTWDEQETLECIKGNRIVLENRTLANPISEIVIASDGCELILKNCSLQGPAPINVAGAAKVTVEGGKIESDQIGIIIGGGEVTLRGVEMVTEQAGFVAVGEAKVTVEGGTITSETTAVDARETAVVHIDGTKVKGGTYSLKVIGQAKVAVTPDSRLRGPVEKEGFAMVAMDGDLEAEAKRTARADKKAERQKALFDKYARGGCKGFHSCFLGAELEGAMVDGEIHMPVDKRGRVKGAKVMLAVPGVSRCAQKVAKGKKIPKFRGPAGTLTCRFNGVVQKEEGSVNYQAAYAAKGKP